MSRNIVVVGIEGYSASSRPEEKTLSSVLYKYINKYKDNVLDFKEIYSSNLGTVSECNDFVYARYSKDNNLLVVGKSLGGVKAYRLLKRAWDTINKYKQVAFIFVDAHSPFPTFIGSLRNLRLRWKWLRPGRVYFNVYQKESYPKGAKVKNATHQIRLYDANHWNIIRHEKTQELIDDGFKYLGAGDEGT